MLGHLAVFFPLDIVLLQSSYQNSVVNQDWMGHSDFSTTANIYAHLDYQSKVTSAEAMLTGLGLKATGIEPLSE